MARILVVDDQKISRLTLAGILGEAGHEVRAEGSGVAGIDVARSWLPDVIVLDVHMPGMDGFEVVERLKRDAVTEPIPVVFLTGDPPTDELVVRGLEKGAYDFLSKGCSKAELLARVGAMHRIKRSHDELSAIARISDALLRSVEPEDVGQEFIREARKVFRADAAILAVERNGSGVLRVADGVDMDEGDLVELLKRVGEYFDPDRTAHSQILDDDEVASLVRPRLGARFVSAGIACMRRGPTDALVLVLAEERDLFRREMDEELLRNLSSQAALAIEHALLNERARRQAKDLERAMTERSRFFASLSHELRTPINAVIGYNHLLQEQIFGQLSDRQSEALEKANRSAQHLLELVDDILDISKIEAGKMEVAPERVDLASLARDTATSLQLQAQEKGIDLEVETPDQLVVDTDPARVRQIVLNLLSNAVKFTDAGQIRLRSQIRGSRPEGVAGAHEGPWVGLEVTDTGAGIPADRREVIFEPFVQADGDVHSRPHEGSGLGLTISRRLARMMGGDLVVESEVGQGSTFTLWLPTAAPGELRPPDRRSGDDRRSGPPGRRRGDRRKDGSAPPG